MEEAAKSTQEVFQEKLAKAIARAESSDGKINPFDYLENISGWARKDIIEHGNLWDISTGFAETSDQLRQWTLEYLDQN